MTEYTYRAAVESDLSAICALGQVVALLHYKVRPEIFAPIAEPERESEHWRNSALSPDSTGFVAEFSGRVIGFVVVSLEAQNHTLLQPLRFARVGTVCVAEDHRGKGIGRQLMILAEQWAVTQGVLDIRLNVWAFNESARHLYDELGYEVRSFSMGKWLAENCA